MVDDDGPGLPPGNPARLFDKFHRGDGEGAIVGVGLGLAICQAIIRAHGGEIAAHRRTPKGSRFEFTLPVASATSAIPPTGGGVSIAADALTSTNSSSVPTAAKSGAPAGP